MPETVVDPSVVLLRSVLTRVRARGGREVRFGPEGIVFVDAMGAVRPLLVEGRSRVPDVGCLADIMEAPSKHFGQRGWGWRSDDGVDVPGHGVWKPTAGEGFLSLRAKKQPVPVLDFLFDADPDDAALFRAGYGMGGCDVFLFVEGDTRARDVASALCVERRLAGLEVRVGFDGVAVDRTGLYDGYGDDLGGPDAFDPDPVCGSSWNVSWIRRHPELRYGEHDRTYEILKAERTSADGEVFVGVMGRNDVWSLGRLGGNFASAARPTVFATVTVSDSRPKASFAFSDTWREAVADVVPDPDAPWAQLARKRAARSAARPKAPKTWHQTTDAVGRAFLEREAPRGLISSGALFFHGPLAYAIWRNNPIAAIVDAPDGGPPLLFVGRRDGIGGTKAGTVSGAQDDIVRNVGGRYRTVHVGELGDFLRIGDVLPEDFEYLVARGKKEAEHPSTCRIDGPALAAWIASELEGCLAAIAKAEQTKFPTRVQAGAWGSLAALADKRDLLAPLVDAELPVVPDAAASRETASRIGKEADARLRLQRQRRDVWGRIDAQEAKNASIDDEDEEAEPEDRFAI